MKQNGLWKPASSVKYLVTVACWMSGVLEEVILEITEVISRAGSCMVVVWAKAFSAHIGFES